MAKPGVVDYYERITLAARTAAPIFRLMNWKYEDKKRGEHVPDEHELAEFLEELLGDLLEHDWAGMASGHFRLVRTGGEIAICLEID